MSTYYDGLTEISTVGENPEHLERVDHGSALKQAKSHHRQRHNIQGLAPLTTATTGTLRCARARERGEQRREAERCAADDGGHPTEDHPPAARPPPGRPPAPPAPCLTSPTGGTRCATPRGAHEEWSPARSSRQVSTIKPFALCPPVRTPDSTMPWRRSEFQRLVVETSPPAELALVRRYAAPKVRSHHQIPAIARLFVPHLVIVFTPKVGVCEVETRTAMV